MKTFLHNLTCLCLIALPGCVMDPSGVAPVIPVPSAQGVYILDEGTFGRGNAELSYYDLTSHVAYNGVFSAVNSRNLGDDATCMVVRGGRGYIVVNNSNKIEVFDTQTNRTIGTVDVGSGKSPKKLSLLNDSLGLVTALYDASVLLVDFHRFTVLQRIPVGENPDGIAIAAGKAFVANSGFGLGRTVSVINLATMSVTATLTVGDNPVDVQTTPAGRIYVVCAGSYGPPETPATIRVLDPVAETVTDSIFIGDHAYVMAIGADNLGYIPRSDKVLIVDTGRDLVLSTLTGGKSYYAVGVEDVSGDVYLSDARDYQQPGSVQVFTPDGQLRQQFNAGVSPIAFAFKR